MNIENIINNINVDEVNNFIKYTSSNMNLKRSIDSKISDTTWIDMVEECIPYLDNIIRNPRRFIAQEENIVPIEKAKVVTKESIRHLAQNTSLIQEVNDDGSVIPLKLLNVYREETIDLYENRFIKSLIDNLYQFVNNKLHESDQKSYSKIDANLTYNGLMKKKGEEVNITINLNSKIDNVIENNKNGISLDERIEHIKEVIGAFKSSTFIKSLKESSPVRSPIRKTNVILKEPNFIKALELWEFLEKNNIKPMMEVVKKDEVINKGNILEELNLAFYLASNITDNKIKDNKEYNSAIISKLVNDFVNSGDISEKEFKRLLDKEFKDANKRKEKTINDIKKVITNYLDNFDKRQKKVLSLLK